MKNTRILLSCLFTILAASSAFAGSKCDPRELEGTWTRSEADIYAAGAGTTREWTFAGDAHNSRIELTDSWTVGGLGPYYAKEIHSEFKLAKDCTLTLSAIEGVARGYREFDEPTPAPTLEITDESGQVTKWKIAISADGNSLRTVGADGKVAVWTKK